MASPIAVSPPRPARAEPTDLGRFDSLFRAHHGRVVRFVRALGVPPLDVDDVAQEVFLVAHRRLDRLSSEASARGWLYSIARRTCANHRRGRARERARREHADLPVGVPDPEQAAGRGEAATILQRFLDGLPEAQRDVFILCDLEGMKAPEAGRALGLAAETVHVRLRLAREKLARVVAEHRRRAEGATS